MSIGNENGKDDNQEVFYGSPENYIMGVDSTNEIMMTNDGKSIATPLDLLKQKFGSPNQSFHKIQPQQNSSLKNMLQRNNQFSQDTSYNSANREINFLNPQWNIKNEEVSADRPIIGNFLDDKTGLKNPTNVVSQRETNNEELDNNNTFASNAAVVTNENQMLISDYKQENVHKGIYHISENSSSQVISKYESNDNPNVTNTNYVQSQTSIQNGDNSVTPMSLIISNTNGIINYQTGVVANQEIIKNLSGPVQNNCEPGTGSHPSKDIPDLRQEFLQMQNLPFSGQVYSLNNEF